MDGLAPTRLLRITRRVIVNKQDKEFEVYEGDIPMADQTDALKALIGDGHSRVTVSREMGEADYGNGGKVFVAVSLTCDQSIQGVESAQQWAKYLADKYSTEQVGELRKRLVDLGIIRPPQP